jgi:hypothetical protein
VSFSSEKAFLAFSCLLLAVACHQLLGLPDRHIRELPNSQELVGTWTIDTPSLKRLKSSHDGLPKTAFFLGGFFGLQE